MIPSPIVLVTGTVAAPIIGSAIGQKIFKFDPTAKDLGAEAKSIVMKFAVLNAVAAAGLGYASGKIKSDTWKSAALGGAIGTALIAGVLGASLVLTPDESSAAQAPDKKATPAGLGMGSPVARYGTWVSHIVGA